MLENPILTGLIVGFAAAYITLIILWLVPARLSYDPIEIDRDRKINILTDNKTPKKAVRKVEKKGFLLLWQYLSETQKKEFIYKNYFTCVGQKTKYKYAVFLHGCPGNIFRPICDETAAVFCIVARFAGLDMPTGDLLLAQKLLIEHDEDVFLATARRTHKVHFTW